MKQSVTQILDFFKKHKYGKMTLALVIVGAASLVVFVLSMTLLNGRLSSPGDATAAFRTSPEALGGSSPHAVESPTHAVTHRSPRRMRGRYHQCPRGRAGASGSAAGPRGGRPPGRLTRRSWASR